MTSAEPQVKVLLVSDLVGSTRLVELLGDLPSAELFERHDRLARDLMVEHDGVEIDKTDGFLLLFDRPLQAVEYALAYQRGLQQLRVSGTHSLQARIGIHLGEVVLRANPPDDITRGAKPMEVEGIAKPMAARVMSLAAGQQVLLTRGVFELARRSAVGGGLAKSLSWLAHGEYLLKGVEEPIEIFEVGEEGVAMLSAPPSSEKVKRLADPEQILGWRPAPGLYVPQRPHWRVEEKLGEGGFGDVWLARHDTTGMPRAFKFCYERQQLRALRREINLFRLLREELGERRDISQILDWNFEVAPYFIESEYSEGGNLVVWSERQGGLAALTLHRRLELVAQIATALQAAHSVGVLHKDVKPENILIVPGTDEMAPEQACLNDFGIGVAEPRRLAEAGITVLGATRQGAGESSLAEGSRLYLAPELLEGRLATTQADVYALGVLLFQAVVGDFRRALAPGWRRDIDDALLAEDIAASVDGSPERRLASAGELAHRLRHLDERREKRRAEEEARAETRRSAELIASARRRRRQLTIALSIVGAFALSMMYQNRRFARAATQARDIARVAVAGEWLQRDPTRAALVLFEVENPATTPQMSGRLRQLADETLAQQELRLEPDFFVAASWGLGDGELWTLSGQSMNRWHLASSRQPVDSLPGVFDLLTFELHRASGRLAGIDGEGQVRVYDMAASGVASPSGDGSSADTSGHQRRAQEVPLADGEHATALAWSADGSHLAIGFLDGQVIIWRADLQQLSSPFPAHHELIMDLDWSPDSHRLATASADGLARVWDLTGKPTSVVTFSGHQGRLRGVAWHPAGQLIATASEDGSTKIWRAEDGVEVAESLAHNAFVSSLAWSSRGQDLATASFDGTVRRWRLVQSAMTNTTVELRQIDVLRGHGGPVYNVAWSPDDQSLLTESLGAVLRIWPANASQGTVMAGHQGWVYRAAWNPDGKRLATVSDDRTVRIWDVEVPAAGSATEAHPTLVLKGHEESVYGVSWSPDGGQLATSSRDATVRIWASDGTLLKVLEGHGAPIQSVAWAPHGDRLLTSSYDATARVWDLRDDSFLEVSGHTGMIWKAVWSPDGQRLATISIDGTARLWSADTMEELKILQRHTGSLSSIAWSSDGKLVATSSLEGEIFLWTLGSDVADATAMGVLQGHTGPVLDVAWSPQGHRLISASWDGTVRLWDVDQGVDGMVIARHAGPVSSAAWSPDGRRIVSASQDLTARIWKVDPSDDDLMSSLRSSTQVCLDVEFRQSALFESPREALAAWRACEAEEG